MAVRVERAVSREAWEEMIAGVFSGCTFLDFETAFERSDKLSMAPRLEEILAEFPNAPPGACFAQHEAAVVAFWLDPHHNYVAIRFSTASGDDFDGFMVNSFG